MGDSIHLEFEDIVVAHEDRRIHQDIVIGENERSGLAAGDWESGGDLAPTSRELNLQLTWLILEPIYVEED